jgi:hypothetical protein
VTDREPAVGPEILVGASERLAALGLRIDLPALGREGYVLRTVGPHLVIIGGEPRGTLYGVYGWLEDHLGCHWFTPEVRRLPRTSVLVVADLDETKVPRLEYREPYTFEAFDGDWAARNRMNSASARLEEHHGGRVRFGDGFFVHTFSRLVPPQKYFATHPEYFSLVGGKRQDGYAQLCSTHPDVIRLCTDGILAAMRDQPDAFVFSVSQNDTDRHCECERCQELARSEGSQMAPVLALVNQVADAVAREFPDKAIETLAYQWTRTPPRNLRPRPNVIIRLCSIECCFAHPLEGCDSPENRAFVADLRGWSRVSSRLWVWDYVTDFAHYLMPFPNQRVRDDNIRLFMANHVTGVFEQDTYNTPGSELAPLGAYLTAKFLWDPDYPEDRALEDFLEAYYGPAASAVREYLTLLHDHVEKNNIHVHIFDPPTERLFPAAFLANTDALWARAESLAGDDLEVARRVRIGRSSVDYAILERARTEPDGSIVRTMARARLVPYLQTLADAGVTRLRESQALDLPSYKANLARVLAIQP